jgi:hypothetical protein
MTVNSKSPINFLFSRKGGTDIQAEVQIWIKHSQYNGDDRPIARRRFDNATKATENQDIVLPQGAYVCVFLCLVREALNGVFDFRLAVGASEAYAQKGITPNPNDIRNFKFEFDLIVV